MICNCTVGIHVKNFMYRIHQFSAIGRNGRNIIPTASDLLGRYPATGTKITENWGGIFLRRPPAADLLADIFRLNRIHTILQIKNQTVSGICLIQYRNLIFQSADWYTQNKSPGSGSKRDWKIYHWSFQKTAYLSTPYYILLCYIRLYQIAKGIASPKLYNLLVFFGISYPLQLHNAFFVFRV